MNLLLGVVVEAHAGLAAQLAGAHHLAHQQGGAVLGIVGLVVSSPLTWAWGPTM